MPREADRRERRELLADALMRLAAARGLEAVSLRHVAAEAGVSTGMVQHHFRTKDQMMLFALDTVMDRIRARSEATAVAATPRDLVRGLLLEVLPLDETRRLENHVMIAFLAYAAVKPSLSASLRLAAAQMRDFLGDQLRAAGRGDVDADHAAAGLLALVDGLGMQLLSRQFTEEDAVAALDTQLALLFGRS
jgi:AcrR family transcriptional regulator